MNAPDFKAMDVFFDDIGVQEDETLFFVSLNDRVRGGGPTLQRSFTREQVRQGKPAQILRPQSGLYFVVNRLRPGSRRRSAPDVAGVRGVFIDLDGAPLPQEFPLTPTVVVKSSEGRYHVYWYCSRKSFKQRCETSPLPAA